MTIEYNSKLIAELYSTTKEKKLKELLNEIKEINGPIFLYPVYEIYKRNKNKSYSHYFLSTLNELNSSEIVSIAIEIGECPETSNTDRVYAVEIFKKRKYYEKPAIDIALASLSWFIEEVGNVYNLHTLIPYLKDADLIGYVENDLRLIYLDDRFDTDVRKYAFGKWLEINPKKQLQTIIENFDEIHKDEEYEYIIAMVISAWKGTKIEELKKLILEKGGVKAKHIIERAKKKKEEKQKKAESVKQQAVQEKYSNADLVEEISGLREKINDAAKSHKHIGFSIFPQNEALFSQIKTANDRATLMMACVNLRGVIQNLSKDIGNHRLDNEAIKKLLPDTAEHDFNKSINKLFLFLHSKQFKIDADLFGLRKLNQILSFLGAHSKSEKPKLAEELKNAKLYEVYENEEWTVLHQNLLTKYRDSLNALLKAIKNADWQKKQM